MTDGQIHYQPRKGVDARFRDTFIEVKVGVDAMRTLRGALFRLAEIVAAEQGASGILLLTDSIVTEHRLLAEWKTARQIIREELLARLSICVIDEDGALVGVPHPPHEDMRRVLKEVAAHESGHLIQRGIRPDFEFVVQKVLLHNLFVSGKAMTVGDLAAKAGCSFPTAAQVVKGLGSLIERTSDRRVRLKYFPRDQFDQFAAGSERARMTTRFTDTSGQTRSPQALLRRLPKVAPENVAVGGVLGARQYLKSLDLIGTPRLDLSVYSPRERLNLDFVQDLDPALKIEMDPQRPVALAVHAIRHAEPLFTRDNMGWLLADEIECLLDLKEAGLGSQASQFLDWLESRAKGRNHA